MYSVRYSDFVVPLVKAVQEQQAIIEALQKENEALRAVFNSQNTVNETQAALLQKISAALLERNHAIVNRASHEAHRYIACVA